MEGEKISMVLHWVEIS